MGQSLSGADLSVGSVAGASPSSLPYFSPPARTWGAPWAGAWGRKRSSGDSAHQAVQRCGQGPPPLKPESSCFSGNRPPRIRSGDQGALGPVSAPQSGGPGEDRSPVKAQGAWAKGCSQAAGRIRSTPASPEQGQREAVEAGCLMLRGCSLVLGMVRVPCAPCRAWLGSCCGSPSVSPSVRGPWPRWVLRGRRPGGTPVPQPPRLCSHHFLSLVLCPAGRQGLEERAASPQREDPLAPVRWFQLHGVLCRLP